jgi:hypothetical protein
MMKKN